MAGLTKLIDDGLAPQLVERGMELPPSSRMLLCQSSSYASLLPKEVRQISHNRVPPASGAGMAMNSEAETSASAAPSSIFPSRHEGMKQPTMTSAGDGPGIDAKAESIRVANGNIIRNRRIGWGAG